MYVPGRVLEHSDCPRTTGHAKTTSLLSFTATCTVNVKALNLTKHCQSATFLNLVRNRQAAVGVWAQADADPVDDRRPGELPMQFLAAVVYDARGASSVREDGILRIEGEK